MTMPSFEAVVEKALDQPPFSNGFEWDCWSAAWCHRCVLDNDEGSGCPLQGVALLLGKTPAQWVDDEPLGLETRYRCTSFVAVNTE